MAPPPPPGSPPPHLEQPKLKYPEKYITQRMIYFHYNELVRVYFNHEYLSFFEMRMYLINWWLNLLIEQQIDLQADDIYLSPLAYPTHMMQPSVNSMGQPMMQTQSPTVQSPAVKILRR